MVNNKSHLFVIKKARKGKYYFLNHTTKQPLFSLFTSFSIIFFGKLYTFA